MILDISPRLHSGIAVWPGDVPLSRELALSWGAGDHLELSSMRSTVHLGAHADAPSHYVSVGANIASRPLLPYVGRCQVLRVQVGRGERVLPAHLTAPITARRVLIHTGTYPDPDQFNEDFAALSPELIHLLADAGVLLVGIDTPSVDPCHDRTLRSHHALAARDLSVLEGLILSHVPQGEYTLSAAPLPLDGFDASPVRAILLPFPLSAEQLT